jgi:hypothetical protein
VTRYPQWTTTEGRLTALEVLPVHEAAGAVKYVYLYENGRLTEEKSFQRDGTPASRKLFRYGADDHGRPSAQVAVTDQGQFAQAEFSCYDRSGLLAEEIMVTAQGGAEKKPVRCPRQSGLPCPRCSATAGVGSDSSLRSP